MLGLAKGRSGLLALLRTTELIADPSFYHCVDDDPRPPKQWLEDAQIKEVDPRTPRMRRGDCAVCHTGVGGATVRTILNQIAEFCLRRDGRNLSHTHTGVRVSVTQEQRGVALEVDEMIM
ncbi:hypothetical protein RRG08_066309 [Elysia crispata]|uniref:Uncharacterized protein n=1 Tax=Elysia crispata TaxID=231223 RepID=A0AAE1AMV9_9GAST|nr:hypothetical protein RRG08_066309 [Elysia crispata]